MNDYIFTCWHCTKIAKAPVELIIPYGKVGEKIEVFLKFMRKHYFCGDSPEYTQLKKDMKNNKKVLDDCVQMITDLTESGISTKDVIDMAKDYFCTNKC